MRKENNIFIVNRLAFMVSLFVFAFSFTAQAQPWSLEQCIEYAKAHNAAVRQARMDLNIARIEWQQAKENYIPRLNGAVQYNFSSGRVLDPTTYDFLENSNVNDLNAAVSLSMDLFAGGSRIYKKRLARIQMDAAGKDARSRENDITIDIISAYLEILLVEDNVDIIRKKIETLQTQESMTKVKVEARVAAEGELVRVKADLEKAYGELAMAQADVLLAKLYMCQLLALGEEQYRDFSVTKPDSSAVEIFPVNLYSEDVIEDYADLYPNVESARMSVNGAKQQIRIARSAMWPSLSLAAGYGTTFSDARIKPLLGSDGLPVTGSSGEIQYSAYPFLNQVKDNASAYVSVSLNIPILNTWYNQNRVHIAKVNYSRAKTVYSETVRQTRSAIRKAVINAGSSYEKYVRLNASVTFYQEAFRYAEARFNADAGTWYEYISALNELTQAEIEHRQAKYEYLLRLKTIDIYAGREIKLP